METSRRNPETSVQEGYRATGSSFPGPVKPNKGIALTLQPWHMAPTKRGCSRETFRLPQDMQISAQTQTPPTSVMLPVHLLYDRLRLVTAVLSAKYHVEGPLPSMFLVFFFISNMSLSGTQHTSPQRHGRALLK